MLDVLLIKSSYRKCSQIGCQGNDKEGRDPRNLECNSKLFKQELHRSWWSLRNITTAIADDIIWIK